MTAAIPANHGKAWCVSDNETLREMFNARASVEEIAQRLQRKTTSVISQLERMHLVLRVGTGYFRVEADPWWDYRNAKD